MNHYKLNWKRQQSDERDVISKRHLTAPFELPDEYKLEFEVPVYDQKNIGSCHDDITEVLTSDGWKLFKDCDSNDLLATVDPITKKIYFENPVRFVEYDYDGEMICATHQNLDFKVTPDHKMLVRTFNSSTGTLNEEYTFVPAGELGWYLGLMNSVESVGTNVTETYIIPGDPNSKHSIHKNDIVVPKDLFLQFLGIYLAEGTMLKKSHSGYGFQIAAVKSREREYVLNLLKSLNLNPTILKDRFTFRNKLWYNEFERLGLLGVKSFDKFIPEFVFNCDANQIKNLLYGHFMGDGSKSELENNVSHYTSSNKLATGLQRLILLSGGWGGLYSRGPRSSFMKDGCVVNGVHPEYRVSCWGSKSLSIDKKDYVYTEYYNGKVYCAEVPSYHTLITRRNNKILISGNCTANSGCLCYRYEYKQSKGDFKFDPSRLFLYYNTREIEGTVNEDSGAYIRDVFKALNKKGLCEEIYFPYIESTFANQPTTQAYANGMKYQTLKYAAVPQFETTIKQTLLSGAAISFGFDVYESFFDETKWNGSTMPIPKKGERMSGGHAVTLIGYSDVKNAFLVQNSWGENWGDNGKFWMPYSFLLNRDHCSDFWCIEEINVLSDEIPIADLTQQIASMFTKDIILDMSKSTIVYLANKVKLKLTGMLRSKLAKQLSNYLYK